MWGQKLECGAKIVFLTLGLNTRKPTFKIPGLPHTWILPHTQKTPVEHETAPRDHG